ncbi:MAG: hypothetical protein KGI70_00220 [Patescibacteria group bacterium]|nr:hypothetical protein [Patescibacteria group bacterium]
MFWLKHGLIVAGIIVFLVVMLALGIVYKPAGVPSTAAGWAFILLGVGIVIEIVYGMFDFAKETFRSLPMQDIDSR